MATYAVGDLQGCLQPLKCLLERVDFDPQRDSLWVAGDLVNRGPESLECLRFLYSMRNSLQVVLGNHDLHLLAVARGHKDPHTSDTLDDIILAPDSKKLLNWLSQHPLVYRDKELGYTMVHAGIPPQWSVKKARQYSKEVEAVLQSDHIDDFLSDMYGNQPDLWDEQLNGMKRLRCITNYFTRMRFCSSEGRLELKCKNNPQNPPAGFAPWFSHKKRAAKKDNIIFGHWAALEGKTEEKHVFALDTGCVWGGALSMMRLDDQAFFHCDCD